MPVSNPELCAASLRWRQVNGSYVMLWQPLQSEAYMRVYGRQDRKYLSGLDKVKPRVTQGSNTDFCPRCGGVLTRHFSDLACLYCGWRECFYFPDGDIENEALIRALLRNNVNLIPL